MAEAFADLSSRTKLCVTGADRVRFLNGQTTNDVRKAAPATQESCVLNAKGHLDAHVFLFATDDAIWIDADETLREKLPSRLERYVIADDVMIADVSVEYGLFHVLAATPPEVSGQKLCVRSSRLLTEGWDIWVVAAETERMRGLLADRYTFLDSADWELKRIEEGIPRWGCELTPDIIPPEANLEARAIDYEKGCYIGQEVVSRMKMSGQTRQRLRGVVSEKGAPLSAGMVLRKDGKVAGSITSATASPRSRRPIGLAMIKRGANEPGTELIASASDRTAAVRVVSLPFAG